MLALARALFRYGRPALQDKALPDPEPVNGVPREPTGFFAGLSPDQKAKALAYRGAENFGTSDIKVKSV
jgi:hypothetical protein